MKIKKILGWLIIIAIFMGIAFAQAFNFTCEYDVSFLHAFGVSIAMIATTTIISVVVVRLLYLVVDWINE